MSKTIQGSILDSLLKSRYPLTYYLSRQQEFVKVFLSQQTTRSSYPVESETNVIHQRKTSLSHSYKVHDTIDHQAPESRKSETDDDEDDDDDGTQECNEKTIMEKY